MVDELDDPRDPIVEQRIKDCHDTILALRAEVEQLREKRQWRDADSDYQMLMMHISSWGDAWFRVTRCGAKLADIKNPQSAKAVLTELQRLADHVRILRQEVERLRNSLARERTETSGLVAALEAEIEQLQEERRWRDADKEWPAGTEWCLCQYRAPTELSVLWFDGHGDWKDFDGEVQYPLHWQPLPSPPEQKPPS